MERLGVCGEESRIISISTNVVGCCDQRDGRRNRGGGVRGKPSVPR